MTTTLSGIYSTLFAPSSPHLACGVSTSDFLHVFTWPRGREAGRERRMNGCQIAAEPCDLGLGRGSQFGGMSQVDGYVLCFQGFSSTVLYRSAYVY